jgi:hypothetical protein
MDYNRAVEILNRHIFECDRVSLLRKIAERPERYIGLFRPTKPRAKLLQNLLQSHEIRFGDAMESLIQAMLTDIGFTNLPHQIRTVDGESLSIDQYFTDGRIHYFIEQKVRDDHDSTKKRGQINNFEKKLGILYGIHQDDLVGIMYFIDPDLSKNKNFYIQELDTLRDFYGVELHLFYGHEFFEYLGQSELWNNLLLWLTQWKSDLPDFPEINLDLTPEESLEEIKSLETQYWRKLLTNDKIWSEGIIQVLFKEGTTLKLLLEHFAQQQTVASRSLMRALQDKLKEYYG